MKFSVIIPTYNRKELLKEALESALNQTFKPYEIIVLDDGSEEDIKEATSSFAQENITYLRQENAGVVQARKRAIEHASGDWIALLDSDDIWAPEYLENVVAIKKKFPEIEFSIANFQDFNEKGLTDYKRYESIPASYWNDVTEKELGDFLLLKPDCYLHFLKHQPAGVPGMAFSMDAYNRIGGMNLEVGRRQAEDAYFCRKLAYTCRVGYIKKVLFYVRKHEVSLSVNVLGNYIDRIFILKLILKENDFPEKYRQATTDTIQEWKFQVFNKAFELKNKEVAVEYYHFLDMHSKLHPKTLLKFLVAKTLF